ncbi:uncharacterized protein PGTG_13038 [Puccinia graminis f. sp. tritici CRL 75-36-700-3]|uniref:Uncharacterized protein n=1 Tax=Puccinia graminis f. sp. tritici (strain CRL 75-36-700-3 / race SCCL) TaxID=418459 RepID=E3KQT1_PUCGT|nr:uncharacterized protein PGTG_13038 [Puccinia graminis f. sp. tritici CRL 75-36-700-3]EFP86656.1 hypothetical protein PGTG_13038 [Puccinia graminis f. sp. tritici CRL 75-36-700-3]
MGFRARRSGRPPHLVSVNGGNIAGDWHWTTGSIGGLCLVAVCGACLWLRLGCALRVPWLLSSAAPWTFLMVHLEVLGCAAGKNQVISAGNN